MKVTLYNKYEFPQPNKGATIIIKSNTDFILFYVSQRIFKGDLKMKIFYTPLVTKYPTIFLSASKYRMNQRFTYQHSHIKMEKTQFH